MISSGCRRDLLLLPFPESEGEAGGEDDEGEGEGEDEPPDLRLARVAEGGGGGGSTFGGAKVEADSRGGSIFNCFARSLVQSGQEDATTKAGVERAGLGWSLSLSNVPKKNPFIEIERKKIKIHGQQAIFPAAMGQNPTVASIVRPLSLFGQFLACVLMDRLTGGQCILERTTSFRAFPRASLDGFWALLPRRRRSESESDSDSDSDSDQDTKRNETWTKRDETRSTPSFS
jgi:hypothetical protein